MATHADMHQPLAAIPSTQAAFDGLLRWRSVYSDSSANPFLATFTSTARVSLPKSILDAPYLKDVAPPHLRDLVNGPVQRMLRSEEEYDALVTRAPLPEPYWDVALRRNRRRHLQLMRSLIRIGLVVALPGNTGQERVSMFFVKKPKTDSLRLIIDARRVNAKFANPPSVCLCSSEGLTRIEHESTAVALDSDEVQVHLGLADIQDAFHRFRIHDDFAAWFCFGQYSIVRAS